MATQRVSTYVVERLNWKRLGESLVRLPGAYPIAEFADVADSVAERWRREEMVRDQVNPFTCGADWYYLSQFDAPRLYDWLSDAGLDPPAPDAGLSIWRDWWSEAEAGFTPGQRSHAWAGLDKLHFYQTIERPACPLLHVVSALGTSQGYWWRLPYEGGEPVAAYQDVVAAELNRVDRDSTSRLGLNEYAYLELDHSGRDAATEDPFAGETHTPSDTPRNLTLHDVTAVPFHADLKAAERARRAFLVLRRGFGRADLVAAWDDYEEPRWVPADGPIGCVEAAFVTRADAEAEAWRREEEAQPFLNPFRIDAPSRVTSLSEAGIRAVLAGEGVSTDAPPAEGWSTADGPWIGWWDRAAGGMNVDQRRTVWACLDKLRLFDVVEVPIDG